MTSYTMGGLIHILLVIAIVVVLLRVIQGRMPTLRATLREPSDLCRNFSQETTMSFALYLVGFLIFTGGVAWALITLKVPSLYVVIACVILLGLGIVTGVTRTRSKDQS